MDDPRTLLPRTLAVIERGLAEGTHVGAQIYISINGEPLADFGVGEARPGVPMSAGSLLIWFSSSKPAAAVAIAQLWERGLLDLDDRVTRYIPEFGSGGKEAITVRHVLTHTGGFRFADRPPDGTSTSFSASWDAVIARICAAPIEEGWQPGRKAGYHPSSGWFILGELVRRLDGRPYERYVREAVFEPLGMDDAWVGMPEEQFRAYGDRIGAMHDTKGATPTLIPHLDSAAAAARCVPGGGGRGPMHDLGRLYEMLLFRGRGHAGTGPRMLTPQTVEALTARHRAGMHDETFGMTIDWGLGLIVDAPGYGRHSSARAFGHGGAESSQGLCDPEVGLVLAVVFNGMPGAVRHNRRQRRISTAVYEDLGLAAGGAAGRNRALPATGLV